MCVCVCVQYDYADLFTITLDIVAKTHVNIKSFKAAHKDTPRLMVRETANSVDYLCKFLGISNTTGIRNAHIIYICVYICVGILFNIYDIFICIYIMLL